MTPGVNALSDEERGYRLQELTQLNSDADSSEPHELLRRFLPLAVHRRALSSNIMVVRGERGAGKSMLFRVLGASPTPIVRYLSNVEFEHVRWVEGFSEHGTKHPTADTMTRFADGASAEKLRVMWMAHLVGCVASQLELPGLPEAFSRARREVSGIARWAEIGDDRLSELTGWLDWAHRRLLDSEREAVVLYDDLDKIGPTSAQVRERTVSSLLGLWLSLSKRYHVLRAKIFVREDLFEASLSASADASKLRSRSLSLTWDKGSLYRLLIRQMAALSPEMREWIQDTQNGVPLELWEGLGWMPPDPLPEIGRPSQARFVDHLAGKLMGRGVKKGSVYNWIPNRLQDARGSIVPRSLLNLVINAAEHARHSPRAKYKRLLHPSDLVRALEKTSSQRVAEIREEYVVVSRLEALKGMAVPVEHAELVRRLSGAKIKNPDGFGEDGRQVAEELARIGVLRDRGGGRWDVPDIYRYGYGIKRRGGAPKS